MLSVTTIKQSIGEGTTTRASDMLWADMGKVFGQVDSDNNYNIHALKSKNKAILDGFVPTKYIVSPPSHTFVTPLHSQPRDPSQISCWGDEAWQNCFLHQSPCLLQIWFFSSYSFINREWHDEISVQKKEALECVAFSKEFQYRLYRELFRRDHRMYVRYVEQAGNVYSQCSNVKCCASLTLSSYRSVVFC